MPVQVAVDMTIKTCARCGSLWGVPHWVGWSHCPMCAGRRIEELESRNRAMFCREQHLRGAITRAKKRAA